MATPLLQKARQQKMIYFGAIVALFTLSLIHREFVVKAQAVKLQLRETVRGEVELTSSAVRLLLTGSRGLAVTMLWYSAIEKQKRNEWHELELLVKSITKLQPYFVTPWLFQSWNISFNVAVECDRPRDKYYYISRGLELLAEGERRNSGVGEDDASNDPERIVFPGNPELRHFVGFFYQLKIGNSDERLTMRSLLEMSCIDPLERNPENFWTRDERGNRQVDMKKLELFAQKYPRLVRRLQEQLGYSNPQRMVRFLEDNQNIPNRFKPVEAKQIQITESELKEPRAQFPILPPFEKRDEDWPNPILRDMTPKSLDVFLVCKAWYEFAQKPLPPPQPFPKQHQVEYDKLRYRVPKQMVIQLFRQYPPRAQVYIAETLHSEGFFDADGWDATAWFQEWTNQNRTSDTRFVFGTDLKYHGQDAWEKSYLAFKDYGKKNGIYLSPTEVIELTNRARRIRAQPGFPMGLPEPIKPEWRGSEVDKVFGVSLDASLDAHIRLYFSTYYNGLSNFDAFIDQAEGEADGITNAARKQLFACEREMKGKLTPELFRRFDHAFGLYVHACFKYPRFAQVTSMMEDICDLELRQLFEHQRLHRTLFQKAAIEAGRLHLSPCISVTGGLGEPFKKLLMDKFEKDDLIKIFPFRNRFGILDRVRYYNGPPGEFEKGKSQFPAKELKEAFLFRWTQGAGLAWNQSVASAVTFPGQEYYLLTRETPFVERTIPFGWWPVITSGERELTRERLGLNR
ncbi:MAG: hypothetical protein HYX68_01180 [Planctomycetes bacterium]|nr:hypothetical protein [Planctomycetota bacterium]